jgi:predicted DNA-binding transcriptional regulator YafY
MENKSENENTDIENEAARIQKVYDSLIEAMQNKKVIAFEYVDKSGVATQRSIEPYEVKQRGNALYVYGHCLEKDAIRQFDLSRIGGFETTQFEYEPRYEIKVPEAAVIKKD